MNETERTEHALSVAQRIEQEFMVRLTTFMRTSVPLEEMDRVQAEHDLRNGIIRPARKTGLGSGNGHVSRRAA
ncbi:MAG TPA: hypothetical protein VF665_15485 [Longimicrobium sp.]|jgi:hypothetical protein|uniref:hypothetical protein n=1 Tax=Longimicrobium sp. TaxID=2029185 RepID=UPI002ED8FF02